MQKYGQKPPVKHSGSNQANKHASMVGGVRVGSPKPSFPPK
jgi:hypothetical protein